MYNNYYVYTCMIYDTSKCVYPDCIFDFEIDLCQSTCWYRYQGLQIVRIHMCFVGSWGWLCYIIGSTF